MALLPLFSAIANPKDGIRDWEKIMKNDLTRMADNLDRTLKPWSVPDRVFMVEDYGAVGDGVTLNTKAIQAAIDDCSLKGGGRVMFTKGEYVTGTIKLKSGVMLEITQGMKILGSTDLKDYPDCVAQRKTVMDTHMDITQSLIFAEGCEQVGITGPGTIDFRGTRENFPGAETVAKLPGRPFGMRFIDSKQIHIYNVNLTQSASWMQDYLNCEDLIVDGVNNFNQTNFNEDGLDIDGCYRVIVRNCFFNVYDDSMCFKGASLRTTSDILVENSTFHSLCNGFKWGTDSQADFRRIVVRNCTLGGPVKGMPTFQPRGEHTRSSTGITLTAVDGSDVEDVWFNNLTINNANCPFYFQIGTRSRLMPGMPRADIGRIERIVVENIKGTNNGIQGSLITGVKDRYVQDVIFRNIDLEMVGGAAPEAVTAEVGEHLKKYPDAFQFNPKTGLPAYGMWFRYARDIKLYNVNVTPLKADPRPKYGYGLQVGDIQEDGAKVFE